jgi:hypothetical protein
MSKRPLSVAALLAVACTGCATGLTGSPETISDDGAVLQGHVVSNSGGPVQYWVEYGPTRAYGAESAHQTIAVAQNAPTPVEVRLTGLNRSATYHYRLCARDGDQQGGSGCGEDRRFTTQDFHCGDLVTTDKTLTGDLDCGGEEGLWIGADGVDINLAGHEMSGVWTLSGSGVGVINIEGYDDITVRNGTLTFPSGIELKDATRNRIVNVRVQADGQGVRVSGGTGNEIRNSDLYGRMAGIYSIDTANLLIAGNKAGGGSAGIVLSGGSPRVVRNRVVRPSFPLNPASGILVEASGGRIADNEVEGAWPRAGILVQGAGNRIVDNVVFGAVLPDGVASELAGDGIFVAQGAAGTVLRRNRTFSNEGDGIQVLTAGTRLGDNAADGNGDFGIDAVAGVIDLGGNTASGNGNPLQCLNVFCQ